MRIILQPLHWLILLLLTSLAVSGWAQAPAAPAKAPDIVDIIGDGKIDWSKQQMRARGIGFAPSFAKTPGQITALAREAAITAAERNLLKVINGVHVTSETTVENLVLAQDVIQTRVSGLLKGAVIVSEKPFSENGYEVVLAVSLFGEDTALARSIDLPARFKQANPEVTITPPASKTEPKPEPAVTPAPLPGHYTGLVIDCRGLNLSRSMCPRILDQTGGNLWSTLTVSADLVNERGIAGYFASLDDPDLADRVGKRPLVVKALRVSGGKFFKTDAVLSPADAERVRAENAKSLFLDKLAVAFLTEN